MNQIANAGKENPTKKHLVVLCGGRSAEHEISLLSTSSILNLLDKSRYKVSVIGLRKDGSCYPSDELTDQLDLDSGQDLNFPAGEGHWICLLDHLISPADVVFPVLHGPFGEDGTVQGALEVLDIPYVGAGVWGSAVAMNKIQTKKILLESGFPVLSFVSVSTLVWEEEPEECLQLIESRLRYPLFVKPSNLGSSVGVNKSRNREDLVRHIEVAFCYDEFIVIEQGIEAREIETAVLGNLEPRISVAGEIIPSREFYSYESKYLDENSRLLIPAPLSKGKMKEVQELALKSYRVLQLEGMARVDFLMEKETELVWINELNTIPGFTRISMYPKLWKATGLPYSQLLDELIALALERHQRRSVISVELKA